jgi:hypothetical protein
VSTGAGEEGDPKDQRLRRVRRDGSDGTEARVTIARPSARGFRTRRDWIALLARLTDGFVRSIPPGGSPARAALPGAPADDPVPSIEGFARMSVAWGAWLGCRGNPAAIHWQGRDHDVATLVARGLADATDPASPACWGPIRDRDQRIVEAAEIATALWLGGNRLRRALDVVDPAAFGRVLDWLAGVDGKELWPDNWVLFPVLPTLIRRAAGRPIDFEALDAALDWMVAHAAGDGWTSDGAGHALDLYSGWAIHWHLLWWAAADGARRPRLAADVRRRSRAWIRFAASLVADDGGFPRFGRSLGYRFASAAPFAQAALLGMDPLPPGVARTVSGAVVAHALAEDALDPASDWFRVGVGGQRPEVVERYVSAGASAWAAHALVALGLPAGDRFWAAPDPSSDWRPPDDVAAAAAGLSLTRRWSGTTLHNARTGHPADIADHDYAATYGKLAYRSAFPFDVPVGPSATAGSDDALIAIDGEGAIAHRNESRSGTAGPGWITSRYDLPARRPTRVRSAVVIVADVEIRLHDVRPGTAIRLRDGGAALGLDGDDAPVVSIDSPSASAAISGDGRHVAIRGLLGFDRAGVAEPGGGRMNLVHDRSWHPWVEESAPSTRRRLVASAMVALAAGSGGVRGGAGARLGALAARRIGETLIRVSVGAGLPATEVAVDLGPRPPTELEIARHVVRGPGLRVVAAASDGSSFRGESVAAIDGVATLVRPGPLALVQDGDVVVATVAGGISVDPDWAGGRLTIVRLRDDVNALGEAIRLDEPGVVPDRLVRVLARRLGTRRVTLRFTTR